MRNNVLYPNINYTIHRCVGIFKSTIVVAMLAIILVIRAVGISSGLAELKLHCATGGCEIAKRRKR